jgi:hypothetical protein
MFCGASIKQLIRKSMWSDVQLFSAGLNMIVFDQSIVEVLNRYFSENEEFVESILLANYGFNIKFANFDIQSYERVSASIGGEICEWNEAPNSGLWGALGRQIARKAVLKDPTLLSIIFESGDSLDFKTKANHYESVIFTFPPEGETIVMEIF